MTLILKYRAAFDALTRIASGAPDPQGCARDAMQRCVDMGGDGEPPLHPQHALSLKPSHTWRRRKAELKRLALPGCPRCAGRGLIVGVRGEECQCTARPQPAKVRCILP